MGRIHELPQSSSRLLSSSQIITSVYCVVKELIENALDGASKSVEVKLENYGLDKIEVKDNGSGIDKTDIQFVSRPHFTSKITSYSDLETINTYGFRGEALGAICAVADLVISTKSSEEAVGCTVAFSHGGIVISTKPCSCAQGSTVSVLNLFKNIPVRRQYYRSDKNKKGDLQKVEELLISYSCIQHDVRFALYHDKNLIWQKPALSSTKNALTHVLGNSIVSNLKYIENFDEKSQRKIQMYLPSSNAPLTCGLSSSSRCIISINKRPVRLKEIDKVLKEYYNKAIQNTGKARYPICFILFTMSAREVDVNIEPNKTNVMLHHSEEILTQFSELLKSFYNTNVIDNNQNIALESAPEKSESNRGSKLNASDFINSLIAKCNLQIEESNFSTTESPVISVNTFLDKRKANFVNNHSSEKTETSMNKKDVVKIDSPIEPKKKKLKSTARISKEDIHHHMNSIKSFFSEDKMNIDKLTDVSHDSTVNVPSVTVERLPPKQNQVLESQKVGTGTVPNKVTTFAVSSNMCSDRNYAVNGNSSCADILPDKVAGFDVRSDKFSNNNNSVIDSNSTVNQKKHLSDSSISLRNVNEDSLKRPNDDSYFQNTSAEDWSRGINPAGGLFQPVKVLQPNVVSVAESVLPKSSDMVNGSRKAVPEQKAFERKLTAFDLFCRSNRLEVAAENPKLSNQQIAVLLSDKWNSLSTEDKSVYKNMLDKNYKKEVKKKDSLGKIVSQRLSQSNKEGTCKMHETKIKPKSKDKTVSFNYKVIRELYQKKKREMPSTDDLNIISYLAPGIWICSKKEKLCLLNTFRLQETVIYHRLLETFQLECEPLDTPQDISADHVGNEAMQVMMELSKIKISHIGNIDDERLTANGFQVKFIKGNEQNANCFELVGVAKSIVSYGIPDLKELLLLIKNKNYSVQLSECRPVQVTLYLQSEAHRMSRHNPACQRVQDVEDLLSLSHTGNSYYECIHHKPFFSDLWNFQSS